MRAKEPFANESKSMLPRRKFLATGAAFLAPLALAQRGNTPAGGEGLPLEQFAPKSMLKVPEHPVAKAKFPLIDWHTHITSSTVPGKQIRFSMTPETCLPVMDRRNIQTMVNLTGGYGDALREAIEKLQTAHPGRFVVFTEPAYDRASEADYAKSQGELIDDAFKAGAKGLKILKRLGLVLRETGSNQLVHIDDKRFDPMWEAAGAHRMPVAIHISDPLAFFLPIDKNNERWEELHAHPDWGYYGKGLPGDKELQEARRNVMRRHPKTNFVCLHVADSEDLAYVSECMDSHPNMYVDIAARVGELGRQPRMARKFFDKYQDRIVFGTDASPSPMTPQQIFGDELYQIYFRFLETEDEYFDYAPAPTPPQGRWQISGVGLPDRILKKIYHDNAARLLRI